MKANEAPEKIYLHLTTGNYKYKPAKIRYNDKIIEYCRADTFKDALHKINTIEVKEVDLNEEIESYFKGFGKFPSVGIDDCIDIAKHFFELGLKHRKEIGRNPI